MDQYYLTVKAYGKETNGSISQATDVFSVSVIPDASGNSGATNAKPLQEASSRGVKCSDEEPGITATIVLDADWGKLGVQRRIEPVSKMSQYSRLGLDQFRLLPAGSKSLLDASVLVAGPGNVRRAEYPGVALSWQIGCGTDASKFPVVTILEGSSKDGSMATKLGHNIIGWHVTNDRSTKIKQQQRVRRQANLMGTPVPTPTPTDMPPKPTAIPETSMIPSTRVIPTESSPMFSSMMRTGVSLDITPTKMISKPATETVRRTLSASPSRKPSTKTTVVSYATPSMTSSPLPPQPSASTVYTTIIEPTPVPVTEIPSRSFTPPMPSMTAVEITPSMIATILPTRTSVKVEETTMVVEPTTTMVITPTPVPPTTPTTPKPPTKKPVTPPKPNTPPKIGKKISRVEDAEELKFYKFVIPEDTFIDAEDGNTRNLTVRVLDLDTGRDLPPNSWIQYNQTTQTLQGLPLGVHVGRYTYILEAFDSEGLPSPKMTFELVVKAKPAAEDAEPPAVSMGMSLDIDFDEFISNPALQLDIMNRIASVFGDADPSAITFTNIQRGSVILAWTNNTIPTDGCNAELIEEIMSKLVNSSTGEPTEALKKAFFPMKISGVEAIPAGPCASPTPPIPTTEELPAKDESSSEDIWISTVLPAVVIAIILLIAGIIIFILYRKNRKGKLSDEDQNTFINKGIPIIFADELEDADKPPSSSTPLIMREEKPPLPPPEYSPEVQRQPLLTNVNNSRNRNPVETRQNVPMVDLAGSPPYQPPPPLSPSPPSESRNSRPGNTPTYRAPPAYVPP